MRQRTLGTAFVLCSAACFGTLAVLGRAAFAGGFTVAGALALRFVVGAVAVWAALGLLRLRGRAPTVALDRRRAAAAFALGGVGYAGVSALFFLGVSMLNAGLTTVVFYTYPLFVVVLSAALLAEPVGARTVAAAPLTLAGVALVAGTLPENLDPRGVAVVVSAALLYAAYIVASRAVLESVDERTLTAYVVPAAAATSLLVGGANGELAVPTGVSGALLAVGLGVLATAVPIFAFFAGVRRVGAGRAGVLSTFEPVVAVALGAALFAEPVSPATAAGAALILAGVAMVASG